MVQTEYDVGRGALELGSSDPAIARLRPEMDNYLKLGKFQLPGFMQPLSKGNATGTSLDCGARNIAGGGFEPPTFGL